MSGYLRGKKKYGILFEIPKKKQFAHKIDNPLEIHSFFS